MEKELLMNAESQTDLDSMVTWLKEHDALCASLIAGLDIDVETRHQLLQSLQKSIEKGRRMAILEALTKADGNQPRASQTNRIQRIQLSGSTRFDDAIKGVSTGVTMTTESSIRAPQPLHPMQRACVALMPSKTYLKKDK